MYHLKASFLPIAMVLFHMSQKVYNLLGESAGRGADCYSPVRYRDTTQLLPAQSAGLMGSLCRQRPQHSRVQL